MAPRLLVALLVAVASPRCGDAKTTTTRAPSSPASSAAPDPLQGCRVVVTTLSDPATPYRKRGYELGTEEERLALVAEVDAFLQRWKAQRSNIGGDVGRAMDAWLAAVRAQRDILAAGRVRMPDAPHLTSNPLPADAGPRDIARRAALEEAASFGMIRPIPTFEPHDALATAEKQTQDALIALTERCRSFKD